MKDVYGYNGIITLNRYNDKICYFRKRNSRVHILESAKKRRLDNENKLRYSVIFFLNLQ